MADWGKVVDMAQIEDEKQYFLSRQKVVERAPRYFYAKDINGKTVMSTKPGISIRFSAEEILKVLKQHEGKGLEAVEVPGDADKRWKRRKKVWK
jgi:hypothetical protein